MIAESLVLSAEAQFGGKLHCLQACMCGMQSDPDIKTPSRIRIRIRGGQHAGGSLSNLGPQQISAREGQSSSKLQQEQNAVLSSNELGKESVPISWQEPGRRQGTPHRGSGSSKTSSKPRTAQNGSSSAVISPHEDRGTLSRQSEIPILQGGNQITNESSNVTGDMAEALTPGGNSRAPSLVSASHLGGSPPVETPQPEEQPSAQGAVSLAGAFSLGDAWGNMLNQTRPLPVFTPVPEEPTATMLQYAAAPAQPPPMGMTCEAWLSQADQRKCVSTLYACCDDSCSNLMRGSAYMGASKSNLAFAMHAWLNFRTSKSALNV